jgi:hypothetical protein
MWPVGYKFKYKSNYGGGIITGVIDRVDQPSNFIKLTLSNYEDLISHPTYYRSYAIYSTNGVRYSLNEIERETLSEIRERKLNKII